MILGLIAGRVIRSDRDGWAKVNWFVAAGLVGIAAGWILDVDRHLPLGEADLDAELDALQRRLVLPAAGRASTRRST